MMIQIDWSAVRDDGPANQRDWRSLIVNWLIKPFTMAALGVRVFPAHFLRPGSIRHGQRIH